ncbi:MAG: DUF3084 domain-containing protein, partial [Pseudanabaena sp. ELA607]|jgi:uncharacterized protein (DUF3084 family)
MAGYTLILAILIVGGIIATIGDRVGSKIGKKRLSIFNLRPRNTAVVVTVFTGGLISASTLGILLLTDRQLRDGLFRLESIQAELAQSEQQKQQIAKDLVIARAAQDEARQKLKTINDSLAQAVEKQKSTQARLQDVETKFKDATSELEQVLLKEKDLKQRIDSLSTEQEKLIGQSEQLRQEKDKLDGELATASKDREQLRQTVETSQTRLTQIEQQRSTLASEIATLEYTRQQLVMSLDALRRGNVSIFAEQVLAFGVIRPNLSRDELRQAVNQLLQQSERNARELLDFLPGQSPSAAVIQVSEAQLDNLIDRISDGKSYIIRILSAGNYLKRETKVRIAADVTVNRQVFRKGEVIASLPFRPSLSNNELVSRIEQLFLLVSFRARREGVLANPITGKVGNFAPEDINSLLKVASELKSPYEVQAIAKDNIFPANPLSIELVIIENGVIVGRFG